MKEKEKKKEEELKSVANCKDVRETNWILHKNLGPNGKGLERSRTAHPQEFMLCFEYAGQSYMQRKGSTGRSDKIEED